MAHCLIQEYDDSTPCVLAEMCVLCRIGKEVGVEEINPCKSIWQNANTRVVESAVLEVRLASHAQLLGKEQTILTSGL
jgi:hypothetical protein